MTQIVLINADLAFSLSSQSRAVVCFCSFLVTPASEPEPSGVGFCFTIDVGTNLKPLDAGSSPA